MLVEEWMETGMKPLKVKDAPDAVYNFSASGGNATENFRLSLGHRKTMGTSIGVELRKC